MKDFFGKKDQFMGKTIKKKKLLNTQYLCKLYSTNLSPGKKGKEMKFSNMYNLFCKHAEYRSSLLVSQHCRKSICHLTMKKNHNLEFKYKYKFTINVIWKIQNRTETNKKKRKKEENSFHPLYMIVTKRKQIIIYN